MDKVLKALDDLVKGGPGSGIKGHTTINISAIASANRQSEKDMKIASQRHFLTNTIEAKKSLDRVLERESDLKNNYTSDQIKTLRDAVAILHRSEPLALFIDRLEREEKDKG